MYALGNSIFLDQVSVFLKEVEVCDISETDYIDFWGGSLYPVPKVV
jgi:hypothetical protein